MALIAYARVSTDEQTTAPPTDVLRRAGCSVIFEERASGADRERPQLHLAIECCRRGDVLVVVRTAGWPARCPTCWRERLEDWGANGHSHSGAGLASTSKS